MRTAATALEELGVDVSVIGPLATCQFGADSDIDLLATKLSRDLKYAIETIVEDCLGDLPFDVKYLDDVPADGVLRVVAGAENYSDAAMSSMGYICR